MKPFTPAAKQQGLTLIELMISITLSLIIMAGIFQIFVSSKQSYRVQEALGRIQEDARFAMDLLTHDLRMAGNVGCNRFVDITNLVAGLPDIGAGLEGYESNGGAMFTLFDTTDQLPRYAAGDAIFIKSAGAIASDLAQPMTSSTTAIEVAPTSASLDFQNGDFVVISDCQSADIFQIAGDPITTPGGNISIPHAALSKEYDTGAQVMPLNYVVYYIGTAEGSNIRNLYRSRIDRGGVLPAEPLVEGVEDLQLSYGESDGNNIRYDNADNVTMDQVKSVRINLLLATLEDNLANEGQSYWYVDDNGDTALLGPANDRRLYRSLAATITLRN